MEAHFHVFDGKPRKVPDRQKPIAFKKDVEDWMFYLYDDPCDLCGEITKEIMVQVPTECGIANYHESCLEELVDRIKKQNDYIESGKFKEDLAKTVKKMP
jgi:hypothetical protein